MSLRLLQRSDAFLQRLDDAFGIGLLLALQLDDGGRSVVHKLLVAELLQHALQETFLVLQLGFHAGDFSLYINHVTQRYGILRRTYHEGSSSVGLGLDHGDGRKVAHLRDDGVEGSYRVLAHGLQLQCFLLRDVLLQADGADVADDFLHNLELLHDSFVHLARSYHGAYHQALAVLAVHDVLPQLFGNEGHERMEQVEQVVEETDGRIVNGLADGLAVSRLDRYLL